MSVVERLMEQRYETPPFPASEFEKALAPFRAIENYLELEARVAQCVDRAEQAGYLQGLKDGIELMWELWGRDL